MELTFITTIDPHSGNYHFCCSVACTDGCVSLAVASSLDSAGVDYLFFCWMMNGDDGADICPHPYPTSRSRFPLGVGKKLAGLVVAEAVLPTLD